MHEMSLCEDVLNIVITAAKQQDFNKVLEVHLEIGELVNVEVDAMLFCFDQVMKNTIADKAKCIMHIVEAKAHCNACDTSFEIKQRFGICPNCEHPHFKILEGDQFKVQSLEVA